MRILPYYFFFLLLNASLISSGQNNQIWGFSTNGGEFDCGRILKIDSNYNRTTVVKEFSKILGEQMGDVKLCLATNGKYYGTTTRSQFKYPLQTGYGLIFEYNVQTGEYKMVHEFLIPQGASPRSGLISGPNGLLYGTTEYGGAHYNGTIFQFNPVTHTHHVLHDFDSTNGKYPKAVLKLASDGKLYGTTYEGGTHNLGTAFQFDLNNNVLVKMMDFTGTNGQHPTFGLEEWQNGWMFGTTRNGGNHTRGVIFKFNYATNSSSTPWHYNTNNTQQGYYPLTGFININNRLYTTNWLSGTVHTSVITEYDPTTNSFPILYHFTDSTDGLYPSGQLILGTDGLIYGTCQSGGSQNAGTLYAIDTNLQTLTTKLHFGANNPFTYPTAGIVELADSTFLGFHSNTNSDTLHSKGFYRFDLRNDAVSEEFQFQASKDGIYPIGKPLMASNDNIYGLNYSTKGNRGGKIFEIDTSNNQLNFIYNLFDDSLRATSSFVEYAPMQFVGVADKLGRVVIYEFNAVNKTLTVSNSFTHLTPGSWDYISKLTVAPNGKIYGFSSIGGTLGKGVIFEYSPQTKNVITLRNLALDSIDGNNWRNEFLAHQNELFIPFRNEINNKEGILSFDPVTNTTTKHYSNPSSLNLFGLDMPLVKHLNGNLFSTAGGGGSANWGGIYEFNLTNYTYTKIHDFDRLANGYGPRGALMASNNLNLYYALLDAQGHENGIEFNTTTNTERVIYSFRVLGTRGTVNTFLELANPSTISIHESPNLSETISFSPNPANSKITFTNNASLIQKTITDINGKVVLSSSDETIDISQLSAGLYLIKLEDEENQWVEKLVVR